MNPPASQTDQGAKLSRANMLITPQECQNMAGTTVIAFLLQTISQTFLVVDTPLSPSPSQHVVPQVDSDCILSFFS